MVFRWVSLSLILPLALVAQTKRPPSKARGHAERSVTRPAPQYDPALINNPNQSEIHPGDKGSAVVRAQILLDRQHFSCGEIDGDFGENLQKTLAAFQQERHLTPSDGIDAATWAALNADQAPALTAYNIAADDVKGPFVKVPHEMMDQAQLPHLGYASPEEGLAERFHESPNLLRALNPGADFSKEGQPLMVPNVLTMPPSGMAARVEVSKSERSVRAYDENGKLLAFYCATIGSEHDPLPVGNWKIVDVERNPEFHYNASLFWDAKNKDDRATIKPGPNNPVGLVWINLSKAHYGIHGTPEPSTIGHTTSHGCIRLPNWDALELAAMVKAGIPALLKE